MAAFISKVKSGDPLAMTAAAFNTIADAVNDWAAQQRTLSQGGMFSQGASETITVRNQSGQPRAQYDVVGLNDAVLKPSDNLPLFAERIVLNASKPDLGSHLERWAILLEPAKNAAFARARISGLCMARVLMMDEAHSQACIKENDALQLQSCAAGGSSQILWVEPPEDRQNPWAWAVVRLGITGDFLAKITASSQITVGGVAQPRWRYAFSEVRLDDDSDGAVVISIGGRAGAVDDGWAINVAELDGTISAPVPDNTIVRMGLAPTYVEGTPWRRHIFDYRTGGDTFVCLVKSDGGSAGASPANWTYAIYRRSDTSMTTPLAQHLTPTKRRAAAGPYGKAADGTLGLACATDAGYALLTAYDEVELISDCNGCP
jgi:hypothetical protein